MKQLVIQIFVLLFLAIGISCSSSKKTQSDAAEIDSFEQENIIVPDTFVLPDIPSTLTNSDMRAEYLVMHYWDRFDFSDTTLIRRPEVTEQAFVDYINILSYVPLEKTKESLGYTLGKAGNNAPMYNHFASLFEKYFYDANSPFRNEDFYIPVLQEITKSDLISDADRSKYEFQLEMVLKNRVAQTANDFIYTLATEKTNNLHSIKSEYLILMFSNPECSTCAAITQRLNKSEALNKAFAMNSPTRTMLTVLTIYPDANVNEWKSYLSKLPNRWINAYDKNMVITKQRLYDIKAIPTFYLLDKDKKVILKDTSAEAVEAFFSEF